MAAPKRNSRELVYEAIKQQIDATPGAMRQTVIRMTQIAKQIELSGTTFAGHVQKLVEAGRLIRVSATSAGVVLALPEDSVPLPVDPGMGTEVETVSADESRTEDAAEVSGAAEAATPEGPATSEDPAPAAETVAESVSPEEVAAAAEPATGAAPEGSLRDRIFDYLKGQIGGTEQEVLLSTKMIADALGTNVNNVAYHLGRLVHAGRISTRSAGPQGTRFRLGGAPQVSATARRRLSAREIAPATAPSTPAAPAAPAVAAVAVVKGALNFCPYCGSKVLAADWRFCASCGQPLGR